MMKDKKIVEKVVTEHKMERAKVSYRIFQVFKLIRRELILGLGKVLKDDTKLRDVTNNHIIEAFHLSGGKKSKAVKGDAFTSLSRLCGSHLSVQESYIFLKKANSVSLVILINYYSKEMRSNIRTFRELLSKSSMMPK